MFVPRNIEKRAKDLEIIKAKELAKYEAFVKDFEYNLKAIQNKTSKDPQEQLFIDLIKDCQIKLNQTSYLGFRIFLFQDNKWMFDYGENDEFLCSYNRVWKIFESKFNIQHQIWQDFIKDMLEKTSNSDLLQCEKLSITHL